MKEVSEPVPRSLRNENNPLQPRTKVEGERPSDLCRWSRIPWHPGLAPGDLARKRVDCTVLGRELGALAL